MKITDYCFESIKFDKGRQLQEGTIINITSPLEFQTPKVNISEINENMLLLKIKNNLACKNFHLAILSFEKMLSKRYNLKVNSIFNELTFKTKVNIKNTKIYSDQRLFNYYQLVPETELLCIITIDKIWINNEINYSLNIKEAMLLKKENINI
jgi:hypothetical protein